MYYEVHAWGLVVVLEQTEQWRVSLNQTSDGYKCIEGGLEWKACFQSHPRERLITMTQQLSRAKRDYPPPVYMEAFCTSIYSSTTTLNYDINSAFSSKPPPSPPTPVS